MSKATRGKSGAAALWRRLPRRARACAYVIAAYTLVALYGESAHLMYKAKDVMPPYNEARLEIQNLPPLSVTRAAPRRAEAGRAAATLHLMGTDALGRDVFARLVQGTRIAFHVGVIASMLAIPLGAMLGLLAGYCGRKTDAILSSVAASVAAIPSVLLILAISLIAGKGLAGIYIGISVTSWVGVFRAVRGETMKHRGSGYAQAARILGYSDARIIFRHILPNVAHIVIIAFSSRFPAAIGTEVFMSFIGIGAQGEPSWGIMMNNARAGLWYGQWWETAFVTLAVFGIVYSFNLLGDALRDALDPATRRLSP